MMDPFLDMEGDRFKPRRFKLLTVALLLVAASFGLGVLAFTQVPSVILSLLMLAGVALVLVGAGWYVWRACSGRPALVIGKQGIWHHLQPRGPHIYHWHEVERAALVTKTHRFYRWTELQLELTDQAEVGREHDRSEQLRRRMGTTFDLGDVEGTPEAVVNSIRKYAPALPVDDQR